MHHKPPLFGTTSQMTAITPYLSHRMRTGLVHLKVRRKAQHPSHLCLEQWHVPSQPEQMNPLMQERQ